MQEFQILHYNDPLPPSLKLRDASNYKLYLEYERQWYQLLLAGCSSPSNFQSIIAKTRIMTQLQFILWLQNLSDEVFKSECLRWNYGPQEWLRSIQ